MISHDHLFDCAANAGGLCQDRCCSSCLACRQQSTSLRRSLRVCGVHVQQQRHHDPPGTTSIPLGQTAATLPPAQPRFPLCCSHHLLHLHVIGTLAPLRKCQYCLSRKSSPLLPCQQALQPSWTGGSDDSLQTYMYDVTYGQISVPAKQAACKSSFLCC